MTSNRMPAAEIDVTVELVRALLAEQRPDLAGLDLVVVANGWDNVMLRLGDDLVVRVPRREVAARLIDHEQSVLPRLVELLPLAIPSPVRSGRPSVPLGYPWPWSVVPWFPGRIVAAVELADPTRDAERFGGFLAALHREASDDAPPNPFRGHFLGDCLPVAEKRCEEIERGDELLARLRRLVDVEPWERPPVWVHGDLHTANVLADDSGSGHRISAVIDWGDVCAGDPATDLSVAWSMFDAEDRDVFRTTAARSEFGVDDATWQRAEGWAVYFAIMYRSHSADNPTMAAIGDRLVAMLLG